MNSLLPHVHWLPRLALAGVFFYHGLGKFLVLDMLSGLLGISPYLIIPLAILEAAAAVLILVGGAGPAWATRIAGALIAVAMLGAILTVHLQYGWNSVNMGTGNEGRGMEFQFTLLMLGLFFAVSGNQLTGPSPKATSPGKHIPAPDSGGAA